MGLHPEQLRHLESVMGASQVTLGSDHPFAMGVDDPVDRLDAAGFDAATSDAIRGGNAARLLGLETSAVHDAPWTSTVR